jgi:arabinogalactan endo-1,4-beta-galactosidase
LKRTRTFFAAALLGALLAACGDGTQQSGNQPPTVLLAGSTSAVPPLPAITEFPGYRDNYTITRSGSTLTITDNVGTGGTVTVSTGVGTIFFYDGILSFDANDRAAQAYRIYQAVFNRPADAAGLGYWTDVLNKGSSLEQIAAGFVNSDEFRASYGSSPSNREVATKVYQNVLGRAPDPAGLDYWVKVLDSGAAGIPAVLAAFSESPENKTLLAPKLADGILYRPWVPRQYNPIDNFAAKSLNSCLWFDHSQEAAAPTLDGALRLATRANASVSLPKVVSQYAVRGDFSADVGIAVDDDFNITVPSGSQRYAGIGLYVDTNNYVLLNVVREGGQTVVKPLVRRAGNFENLASVTPGGKVRHLSIQSKGAQLQFSYATDQGSAPAGSAPGFGDGEYLVTLHAATIGNQAPFTVGFSDYTASGTHSYRPYVRGPLTARADLRVGGVVESYLYEKLFGQDNWGSVDPFEVMAANGMGWLRTTVTTQSLAILRDTPTTRWNTLAWNENYWQSQEVTAETLRRAQARGMDNVLSFFFSDTAANSSAQNAPAAWRGLSVQDTAQKLFEHTKNVAADYKARGLHVGVYEVGNEADLGILNFRPGERIPLPPEGSYIDDLDYMRTKVWSTEAVLLKAAIAGIRSVDPNAKIALHAAMTGVTPADIFVKAFYKSMVDNGVDFDIAGLSLPYPQFAWRLNEYTTDCWFGRLQETTDYIARLGKKAMVAEAAYPNSERGMVGKPMVEFPYTEAGQAAWVREHLRFANNNPNMAGFLYFYPDWYPGQARGNAESLPLEAYGLFDAGKGARPALRQFKLPPR